MNVLFIHQNFPGQFIHLSGALATDPANTVVALTLEASVPPPGVMVRNYTLLRPSAQETHPLLREQEAHVLRAEACAAAALQLKREGFEPDLIVAHPGWGEALFIKDVFPLARVVLYCEYYYALEGQDVGFDPAQAPLTFAQRCQLRLKNTSNLLSLEIADAAISPTRWQKSTYPAWTQEKITVVHDGIDVNRLKFDPTAELSLETSTGVRQQFCPGDEVLTYIARNLEPVRGFDVFMRSLPDILQRRPKAKVIIVGDDGVSYGPAAPDGRSWKDIMLAEVGAGLDMQRIHFVGQVPYQTYLTLLNISRVHAYWTTPFVLSWSLLEAASSGLPVIASDTAPVAEFADALQIETLPYFDHGRFADTLTERLRQAPAKRQTKHVPHIALDTCLRAQIDLIQSVMN